MVKKIFLAFAISWGFAVTLGLFFAVRSYDFSLRALGDPFVLPVALLQSTCYAILVTPASVWALRSGKKNLILYGALLWLLLALYITFPPPFDGIYHFIGLLVLSLVGLVVIGLIPPMGGRRSVEKK